MRAVPSDDTFRHQLGTRGFVSTVRTGVIALSLLLAALTAAADDAVPAASPDTRLDTTGCAANCLYVTCRLFDLPIGYEKCFELLPRRESGNSMLELKEALEQQGLEVTAAKLTAAKFAAAGVVQIPLTFSEATGDKVGHYIVVRPVNAEVVQVLDFPGGKPQIVARDKLSAHLRGNNHNQIPTLRVGRRGTSSGLDLKGAGFREADGNDGCRARRRIPGGTTRTFAAGGVARRKRSATHGDLCVR